MGRERFARRQSKLRWQVCSIGMLTRSPTMAADAWCATAIPYPHHGKARAAIAVRCPRVRDRGRARVRAHPLLVGASATLCSPLEEPEIAPVKRTHG